MNAHTAVRIAFALLLGIATTAQAQLFRAYVASDGNDANPCTLPQPCRLLPKALTVVNNGGEIWMLDSANFNTGTVTIDKSVSILAIPGAVGSIVALNGGAAVSITAPSLRVVLRNVVIGPVAGAAAGTDGVSMTGASSLLIEKSVIAGMPTNGIYVSDGNLRVFETTIRDSGKGVLVEAAGRAVIASSRLLDNADGVFANANLGAGPVMTISVDDTIISGGISGVRCAAGDLCEAHVAVARSTITGTAKGVNCTATAAGTGIAQVVIGGSKLVYNAAGWTLFLNATLSSLGDNQIHGNGASTGTLTPLAPQ